MVNKVDVRFSKGDKYTMVNMEYDMSQYDRGALLISYTLYNVGYKL